MGNRYALRTTILLLSTASNDIVPEPLPGVGWQRYGNLRILEGCKVREANGGQSVDDGNVRYREQAAKPYHYNLAACSQ
jgi:hypothetical protein